jgi:hypothetical protein
MFLLQWNSSFVSWRYSHVGYSYNGKTAFLGSFEGEDEMVCPTWVTVDADVIGRGFPLFRGSFIFLEERMVHRIACSVQSANDRRCCLVSTFVFVRQ